MDAYVASYTAILIYSATREYTLDEQFGGMVACSPSDHAIDPKSHME